MAHEAEAKRLAETWTEKWVESMKVRDVKITDQARKRYYDAMEREALFRLGYVSAR